MYLSNNSRFYKDGNYRSDGVLTERIYPNLLKDVPVTKHHVILKFGGNHQFHISVTFSPEQGMPVTQWI